MLVAVLFVPEEDLSRIESILELREEVAAAGVSSQFGPGIVVVAGGFINVLNRSSRLSNPRI